MLAVSLTLLASEYHGVLQDQGHIGALNCNGSSKSFPPFHFRESSSEHSASSHVGGQVTPDSSTASGIKKIKNLISVA
jgi:hypothetical protein